MKLKSWKKRIAILLSLIMTFSLCGGFWPQTMKAAELVSFTVSASSDELVRGETVTYTVDMSQNESGSGLELTFTYDDSMLELQGTTQGEVFDGIADLNDTTSGIINVVIVSNNILKNGNVFTATFKVKDTASGTVNAGIDTVGLINGNYEDLECNIANNASSVKVSIPVEGISVDKSTMTLEKGTSEKLTATVLPEDTESTVEWSSSDKSVATVDKNGTVTAVGKGTATITAKAGTCTASCSVTVTIPLESIKISGKANTIFKGKTTQLEVTYNPADTTDSKKVVWSSSDESIASVSENGTVTALKDGTVTITAAVGEKTADYNITVKEIKLTAIEIQDAITIHKGETAALEVKYTPVDTTDDTTVIWSSNDESIVSVDANGKVTAKAVGSAVITAQVGKFKEQCTVTVDAPLKDIVSSEESIELIKKQTGIITYSFNPIDTTDERKVTFSSSDDSIVSVDENGTLTAKKAGTVYITLMGANNVSAVVKVTVREIPIDTIVLDAQSKVLEADETDTLQAVIKPENNTDDNQMITWSSSDEKVVIVEADKNDSSKATIKAVAGGTAVITAKAWNGTSATCTIKIPKHIESIELTESAKILRGNTKILDVIVNPADTDDDTTVTWTSSDPTIASVDKTTGMITAMKEGTVEITATTNILNPVTNQPYTATAAVIVKENHLTDELAKNIAFDKIETILMGQKMDLNDALNLQDIVTENKITDDIVINWTSSDEDVAVVNQRGILCAVKAGTTTITVTIEASDAAGNKETYEAAVKIDVKEIPLESIAFDQIITEMQVGDTEQLNVIYNPQNTTDDKTIVWSSSDSAVITVDNGILTAKKAGTAIITAKVGDKNTSCKITVKEADTTIKETDTTIKETDTNITEGNTTSDTKKTESVDKSVKTGDSNNGVFFAFLMLCACAGVIISAKKFWHRSRR